MKAFLKNHRQSPRKVRLIANLIKGRNVIEAINELDFLTKKASLPIKKLLLSAIANAKALGIEKEELIIKELRVDKGIVMKRIMPAAMGSVTESTKEQVNITLLLAEKMAPVKENKKEKKEKKILKIKKVKKLAPKA